MAAHGWRVWVLGTAIVALLAAGVTSVALRQLESEGDWDSRVQPLADFVEEERGLEYDHAVPVEFLEDEEFNEEMTGGGGDGSLTQADREEAEQFGQLFRAVGLASGNLDMLESGNQLVEEGTLAAYLPEQERILVRGTEMNVKLEATLVHELTHALQDQHYDLSQIENSDTSGEELAFLALAEGDADRIEYAYVDSLPSSEEDEYYDDPGSQEPEFGDVPPALVAYFSAPYDLGDTFVALIDELAGQDGVNDAFADPPTTEENLLDPFTYLAGEGAKDVDQPALEAGEKEFDSGDWGAVTWLLMLGARIDPHVALRATDGWGGDAYVAFERAGTTCVRIAYTGDTPKETDEMAGALNQWVAAMPPGAASVQPVGANLVVNACDPGAQTDARFAPDEGQMLVLPAARSDITREFLSQGAPEEAARCIAQRIVDSFTLDELADLEATSEGAEFEEKVDGIVGACRRGT